MINLKHITDEEFDSMWEHLLESGYTTTIRLNRSKWKACPKCEDYSYKCCANCANLGYFESPCLSCEHTDKWKPCSNFCSACGRPLTDKAWNVLEEKLNKMR